MAARRVIATALCALATMPALAQDRPLSAIDWLTDSVDAPPDPATNEPAVSGGVRSEEISVTTLDSTLSNDAVGLLPGSVTGLPVNLWGTSASADLATGFERARSGLMPAMQSLLLTLLLAETNPPADSDPTHALFLARLDTLIWLGALDQALSLLQAAQARDAESFKRWFDVSLLLGTEDEACTVLAKAPDLAPDLAARIYCLARNGDWNAAAVTLETGRALGQLTGSEDAILTRFLDPEAFDGVPPLAPPARPTPLMFRLYEAAAEPIPTTLLPVAFAHADLRSAVGWKAQIEAAERLVRSGAIDANRLMGLYTERDPAASGGVWDRVAAVQALDRALVGRQNPDLIAPTVIEAWDRLSEVSLQPFFAAMFSARMEALTLPGEAGKIAYEAGFLNPTYEVHALTHNFQSERERFLKAVARGQLDGVKAPGDMEAAIADGFRASGVPDRFRAQIEAGNLGEALLRAIRIGSDGAQGDLERLAEAIAFFRAVGLEDVARRLALQSLILVEEI